MQRYRKSYSTYEFSSLASDTVELLGMSPTRAVTVIGLIILHGELIKKCRITSSMFTKLIQCHFVFIVNINVNFINFVNVYLLSLSLLIH